MSASRQIQPKMVAYLDRKLASNGLAAAAVKTKNARLLFRLALEACVGIREKSGRNDGPIVELIQRTIGAAAGEAWCMSLVQTGLAYAERKTGCVSPVAASEHCLTVWARTPKSARVKNIPAIGAIIIWRHGLSDRGHTGITISEAHSHRVDTVEGNTSSGLDNGEIVREGGGVYVNTRSLINDGKMHVVGCLKPF